MNTSIILLDLTTSLEDIQVISNENGLNFDYIKLLKTSTLGITKLWFDTKTQTGVACSFSNVDGIGAEKDFFNSIKPVAPNFNLLTMASNTDEVLEKINKRGVKSLAKEELNILNETKSTATQSIIVVDLTMWMIELEAICKEYSLDIDIITQNKTQGFKYLWIDTYSSKIIAYNYIGKDEIRIVENVFNKVKVLKTKKASIPVILDVDTILDKITEYGIDSLVQEEKDFLKNIK
jgi:hypothetical protein